MKKKLLSLIIMCIMAVSVLFVGCTPKGLRDNPATDANVVSNGGMTVVKGDYLYFVNGFEDETKLTKYDNKYGKVTHAGIYRTKLVNGQIQKDKDGFLSSVDQVVSKVVGFSNGGFYIIDDYIYYATPYMNLDREGVLQSSRVEFHKIRIDGTEDKTLYVTDKSEDNLDWTLYKVNGKVYIATYVDSKIIIVNTEDTKDIKTIENSTSYAFLQETDYNTNMTKDSECQNYIYYTRAISTDDKLSANYKGNIMCKVNIATGEKTEYTPSMDYTYSIIGVTATRIYYTKTNSRISGLSLLHQKDLISTNWENAEEIKLANAAYSNYYICNFGLNLIIADDSNGTYLLENGETKTISSTQKTVIGMSGNNAYYTTSDNLYTFDVRGEVINGEIGTSQVSSSDITHKITNSKFWDFDGQRVFVYAEYTSSGSDKNYYLNYIEDEKERFVGKFAEGHTPAQPDQDENYGKDPDIKYIPWID